MTTEDNNNADAQPPFRCSCCERELNPYTDMAEFQESLHIHYHAGPGSTYIEPGSLVECVLCQGCISVILGRWLRVTPGHAQLLPDGELLRGEMPVFLSSRSRNGRRGTAMNKHAIKQFLVRSVRIFLAPAIGAVRQMRFELRRVDRDIRRNAHQKKAG